MNTILLGTKNPYKRGRLAEIVAGHYTPHNDDALPDVEEVGNSAREIAEQKAIAYSLMCNGYAVSTDGGAVIPSLPGWDPLRTRRFAASDKERIATLLEMMRGAKDRTVEWHEAIALAHRGELLFSETARAMDGVIDETFNPQWYCEGIWLCSITSFPQFGGRNYFELTDEERAATEDSWSALREAFARFQKERC